MSIGMEPPYGWGGPEPIEVVVKILSGTFVLGDICALNTVAASVGVTVGADDMQLSTAKACGAWEDTKGIFGVVTDLQGGSGGVGAIMTVCLRGICKARVGQMTAAALTPSGQIFGIVNGDQYGTTDATAGTQIVGLTLAADFTPTGFTYATAHLVQVLFDGTRFGATMP